MPLPKIPDTQITCRYTKEKEEDSLAVGDLYVCVTPNRTDTRMAVMNYFIHNTLPDGYSINWIHLHDRIGD